MEIVIGPVERAQLGVAPLGGVILKLIAPVGWIVPRPATPVTVAVKIVVPPRVGLAEATKEMVGACALKLTVLAVAKALV